MLQQPSGLYSDGQLDYALLVLILRYRLHHCQTKLFRWYPEVCLAIQDHGPQLRGYILAVPHCEYREKHMHEYGKYQSSERSFGTPASCTEWWSYSYQFGKGEYVAIAGTRELTILWSLMTNSAPLQECTQSELNLMHNDPTYLWHFSFTHLNQACLQCNENHGCCRTFYVLSIPTLWRIPFRQSRWGRNYYP